jgi:hypothetical protein
LNGSNNHILLINLLPWSLLPFAIQPAITLNCQVAIEKQISGDGEKSGEVDIPDVFDSVVIRGKTPELQTISD